MSVATITTPDTTDTAWTMPAGLDASEQIHYRRGYSRAYAKAVKLNPTAIGSDGPSPAPGTAARTMLARRLAGTTRTAHEAHHPAAHKAGMAALKSYVRKSHTDPAARLAAIVDPAAPAKAPRKARKVPAAPAVVAAPDTTPAAVVPDTTPDDTPHGPCIILPGDDGDDCTTHEHEPADIVPAAMPGQTRDARRASNRELAAAMRARGILPTGPAWTMARAGADLDTLAAVLATIPAGGAK